MEITIPHMTNDAIDEVLAIAIRFGFKQAFR
jgi:hypothetical protein